MIDTRMDREIISLFRRCSNDYLGDIRKSIPEFPKEYFYPTGNPIRPVLPVQVIRNNVMVIGAFPSARFQFVQGKLIPVADNLAPFAKEEYFDGRGFRKQASRESLEENFFRKDQLNLRFEDMWITDLVRVYLFPEKHIKNCKEVAPERTYVNTHDMFKQIAKASRSWMEQEIAICDPKIIITLGEVAARVMQDDWKTKSVDLLNGSSRRHLSLGNEYKIAHLAHPEIRRISKDWDERTKKAIKTLRHDLNKILN